MAEERISILKPQFGNPKQDNFNKNSEQEKFALLLKGIGEDFDRVDERLKEQMNVITFLSIISSVFLTILKNNFSMTEDEFVEAWRVVDPDSQESTIRSIFSYQENANNEHV